MAGFDRRSSCDDFQLSQMAFRAIQALYLDKKRVSMSPIDKWIGAGRRIFRRPVEGRIA
jgi:hypothetical protein